MVVVALAVPFLLLDTPALAEGLASELVETSNEVEDVVEVEPVEDSSFPDVAQLAELALNFRSAQAEVVEAQTVEERQAAAEQEIAELDAAIELSIAAGIEVAAEIVAEAEAAELAAAEAAAEAERAAAAEAAELAAAEAERAAQAAEVETEAAASAPTAEAPQATDSSGLTPPAQVDGRVPPPAGGPTAAQWDQVRNCESTHNYGAVNPSGKFRGAYQFSTQTWDWVASVHHPHLVGVDPAAAAPAWQDVMAYTLHDMSGPGQWPECGRYLY